MFVLGVCYCKAGRGKEGGDSRKEGRGAGVWELVLGMVVVMRGKQKWGEIREGVVVCGYGVHEGGFGGVAVWWRQNTVA